jgi:hypothetical protein
MRKAGAEGWSFQILSMGFVTCVLRVRSTWRGWGALLWRQNGPGANYTRRWVEKTHGVKLNQIKAGTVFASAKVGLLPRKSVLSQAAVPGLALLPLACCHAVPRASYFVGGNHLWRHGWESMTEGDLGTYGATFRVTPMTDGTRHLIRMANRATVTSGAGVILRGQAVVGIGFLNPEVG